VLGDPLLLQRHLLILLDAATHAAMSHTSRAVRVRFGLMGTVGVARVIVGDGSETGALPECASGAITHRIEESHAGVAYVLVLQALGAGAE
jgi:hypothetical protein